jgi:hypothetical protein
MKDILSRGPFEQPMLHLLSNFPSTALGLDNRGIKAAENFPHELRGRSKEHDRCHDGLQISSHSLALQAIEFKNSQR